MEEDRHYDISLTQDLQGHQWLQVMSMPNTHILHLAFSQSSDWRRPLKRPLRRKCLEFLLALQPWPWSHRDHGQCPMRQMELVTVCLRALQQSNCLLREKDEQELRAIKAERQVERLMMANTSAGTPIAGGDAGADARA